MAAGEPLPPELLRSLHQGGQAAAERLFELLYDELRHLAGRVRHGRASETLSTTALVHEAYIKLTSSHHIDIHGRRHFYRLAARAMRQILVDAARRRTAEKRGGDPLPVTFDEADHPTPMPSARLVSLDQAIDRLAADDPRAAQVVECRFFAGLSVDETATALEISPRTVKRDWRVARARLAGELTGEDG